MFSRERESSRGQEKLALAPQTARAVTFGIDDSVGLHSSTSDPDRLFSGFPVDAASGLASAPDHSPLSPRTFNTFVRKQILSTVEE